MDEALVAKGTSAANRKAVAMLRDRQRQRLQCQRPPRLERVLGCAVASALHQRVAHGATEAAWPFSDPDRTCIATARDVGCSKTIVGETAKPVNARSRNESSDAASESTPASMSGVSAVRVALVMPVSSKTTRSTSDST
eukprot:1828408-Prymnesium_polylepis.1